MKTIAKLVLLGILLNLVRYLVGGPIESWLILEPMHRLLPLYPEVFDSSFDSRDLAISFLYNYLLWFWASVVFHLMQPALRGPMWLRSLESYGLMALFFCSLAAVYMNHYSAELKTFYLWSMVDALILFPLVALANGALYPRFFPEKPDAGAPRGRPPEGAPGGMP